MLSVRLDAHTPTHGRMTAVMIVRGPSATDNSYICVSRRLPGSAHQDVTQAWFSLDGDRVQVHRDVVCLRDGTTGRVIEKRGNSGRVLPVVAEMITAFTGVPASAMEPAAMTVPPAIPAAVLRAALDAPTLRYTVEVVTLDAAPADVNLAESAAATRAARHACSVVIRRLPQNVEASAQPPTQNVEASAQPQPQRTTLATLVTERARRATEEPDDEDGDREAPQPSRDPSLLPELQARIRDSVRAWYAASWPSADEVQAT